MNNYEKIMNSLPNCVAIYETGSSVILPSHHDTDLLLVFKTKQDMLNGIRYAPHYTGYDLHFAHMNNINKVFVGAYVYPYMVRRCGRSVEFNYNILENKEEYMNCLSKSFEICDKIKTTKKWYHIVIGYYILLNNSYDLTSVQKEMAYLVYKNQEIPEELRTDIFNFLKGE